MNLSELAAQYGGKPIEKEQPNDLAAQFGGKPIEKTNSLAEQFGGVPIKKTEAEPPPEKESFSTLREVADIPLQLGKGAVTGIRMVADAFGAGSDISKTLKSGEDYLGELMSAQSKQDSKEISRIMKEAEDKGVLDQVIAGVKALSIAPVDTIVNSLGTAAPAILAGLAITVAGAPAAVVTAGGIGVGALMGAGNIKNTIYDAVKEELSKTDIPKDKIEEIAQQAQNYKGKNLDMIALGAIINAVGAGTGIEPAIAKNLAKGIITKVGKDEAKNIVKEETKNLTKEETKIIAREKATQLAKEETENIAKQGIKKYAAKEGAIEFGTEFGQAGHEQFSENLALRREGYDVPLMRGVISNAVLEGVAGLAMGTGMGAYTAAKAKQAVNNTGIDIDANTKDVITDIIKHELESKGINTTADELDLIIDDILKNPPKKEEKNVAGDNNRVDTGTDKSGIPISKEQTGQGAAAGAGETTTTDVGGAGQTVAGTGNREVDESGALTGVNPNLDFGKALSLGAADQAYIQMFDAYKNGSTKMGGLEDSVLRTAKTEGVVFNSPEEIQQYANNNQEKIKQTAQKIRLENIEKNQTKSVENTQEQVKNAESIAEANFINVIDQMKEYESPEQAFDSALINIIDTLKDQGIKDPAIYDAASNKLNALIREYEGRAKNDTQEQQEADRIKETETRRDELANAWAEYNAPKGVPVSNVTEAKTTEKVVPDIGNLVANAPKKLFELAEKVRDADEKANVWNAGSIKRNATMAFRRYSDATHQYLKEHSTGDKQKDESLWLRFTGALEGQITKQKEQLNKVETTEKTNSNKLISLETVAKEKHWGELFKESFDNQFKVLTDLYNKGIATDANIQEFEDAIKNSSDQMTAVAKGYKVIAPLKKQLAEIELQRQQIPAANEPEQKVTTEAPTETEPAKQMSEDEKNLRHVSNTPELTALPQELQDNPEVQKYHEAFNTWVTAKQDNMDPSLIADIKKDVAQARQALPQEHPAAIKTPIVETKKQGKPSKEDVAKAKELKVVQAQINELRKQLSSFNEEDQARIQETIDELTKQARKLAPKDTKLNKAGLSEDVSGNIHPTVYDAIQNNDIQGVLTAIYRTGSEYTRSLAQRLLSLNLNTSIFFNNQDNILQLYVLKVNAQKNKLEKYLNALYPEAATYIDQDLMSSPIRQTAEAYKFLREQKNISFAGLEQQLKDVIDAYEEAANAYDAPGFYVGNNVNAINLNTNIAYYPGTTTNHVLLHEILHAATQWAIHNRDKLTREQRYALDDLTALFNYAKERSKDQGEYGFTDLDEFVAEAYTNKDFQKFLKGLQYEMAGPKTAWSRFMQVVGKLFGNQNVLFHTLAKTELLFSANTDSSSSGLTISPMGRPRKNTSKTPKPVVTTKVNNKENIGNALINDAISGRMTWKNLNKKNLIMWLSSQKDQRRKFLLGGFTLDQITDMVGEAMPYFKQYRDEKDAMINTRNQILGESEQSIAQWSSLQQKNPDKAKQLDTAMIEATFAKVDPDPKGKGYDAKKLKQTKAGKQAQAAWDAMEIGPDGAEAIKIYRDVRNFYERRMNEYIRIVLQRLALNMKSKDIPNAEIKKAIEDKYAALSADIIKPYFPIKRFGEFWLQVGKGKSKIFMQFEDATSRNIAIQDEIKRLVQEKMSANASISEDRARAQAKDELTAGNSFSTQFNAKLADAQHMDSIYELINKTTADVQTKTDPDKVESLRKNLLDGFDQWYLELMPSQSIRKMFIHRKNVPGLSGDMFRAFAESRQRIAYQRSRFEHLPQLFQKIDLANDALKFMPLEESTKWRDYVRELELNLKTAVLEPPKQSSFTTFATQAGFLYYLTSPASAIVNAMAIPGIYIPAANPKYGTTNVTTSLARYNRMLFATADNKKTFKDEKTGRFTLMPSLARSNLKDIKAVGTEDNQVDLPAGKTLAEVYDAGVRLLVIDTTLAHDNAAMAETSSNKYTGRWQKTMYYASLPFHAMEKYNRETTFMATFDMAYRKYIDKGYTKEKAYESAISDARNLVQETMFNYEATNKPRYFRGDTRNIILQFKQYPQHMAVLLWRTFEKAWINDIDNEMARYERQIANSPADIQAEKKAEKRAELEQLRKESRQQFMGMLGMSFITAGMSGLPMAFIFFGVAKAMQAIFGDDDDDFDVENWFKNWCEDTFGGFAGHAINRGFLSAATGINFADRMSINLPDMWFPDVKPSNDLVTYTTNMMVSFMGPTANMILKVPDAIEKYKDGNTERAIEALMPSVIKNVMVGTRYLVEGEAKNLAGATVVDEVNAAQALTQMLGFTPEKIAQAQTKAFKEKNAAVKIENAKTNILNGFFIAIDTGDAGMLEKSIEKIQRFNRLYPTYPIQAESIRESVKTHYENRVKANLHGGVNINKKLYPILDELYR